MGLERNDVVANAVIGATALPRVAWQDLPQPKRRRLGWCAAYLTVLTALFIQPLARLMLHASGTELHSHIPLVPALVAYLLFVQRRPSIAEYRTSGWGAAASVGLGLATFVTATQWRGSVSVNDELAIKAFAFVSFLAAGGFIFCGSKWMASAAFPMSFLLFMIPMPDAMANTLEILSMRASADMAAWFLTATGMPLLRNGQVLALPGIVLEVAQECSGIRSSWVLFITSLLASHLFLKSPWHRFVLVAFVFPLGIVRNGFRILVIGLLCVHVGPYMIDSYIHHQGGPVFFVLSLGPLFLLLWRLRRREQ